MPAGLIRPGRSRPPDAKDDPLGLRRQAEEPPPHHGRPKVAKNQVHVIFDNESLLSVGGFPTATSTRTDLAGVASTSGIRHVTTSGILVELDTVSAAAEERGALSVLVAKVEAVGPASFRMDIGLLENRFQFERYLRALQGGT